MADGRATATAMRAARLYACARACLRRKCQPLLQIFEAWIRP